MVDPEAVRRRLREIDGRLRELHRIRDRGRDAFHGSSDLRTLAERHLQIAIQAAIDVAVHILAEDSSQTPEDYGAAFRGLARMGIVEPRLGEALARAAGLRNILVHMYLEVDPEKLWRDLGNIEGLERFAAAVEEYVPN